VYMEGSIDRLLCENGHEAMDRPTARITNVNVASVDASVLAVIRVKEDLRISYSLDDIPNAVYIVSYPRMNQKYIFWQRCR
jgi:hypothetical protein